MLNHEQLASIAQGELTLTQATLDNRKAEIYGALESVVTPDEAYTYSVELRVIAMLETRLKAHIETHQLNQTTQS